MSAVRKRPYPAHFAVRISRTYTCIPVRAPSAALVAVSHPYPAPGAPASAESPYVCALRTRQAGLDAPECGVPSIDDIPGDRFGCAGGGPEEKERGSGCLAVGRWASPDCRCAGHYQTHCDRIRGSRAHPSHQATLLGTD